MNLLSRCLALESTHCLTHDVSHCLGFACFILAYTLFVVGYYLLNYGANSRKVGDKTEVVFFNIFFGIDILGEYFSNTDFAVPRLILPAFIIFMSLPSESGLNDIFSDRVPVSLSIFISSPIIQFAASLGELQISTVCSKSFTRFTSEVMIPVSYSGRPNCDI